MHGCLLHCDLQTHVMLMLFGRSSIVSGYRNLWSIPIAPTNKRRLPLIRSPAY